MHKAKTCFLLLILAIVLAGVPALADGIKHYPKLMLGPTLSLDNGSLVIYVLFKFGAWNRVAYNNSRITAPVMVYVYSKSRFPVMIRSNYNTTWQGYWGLALNLTKLDLNKPLLLTIKYRGSTYNLRFQIVKSIKEITRRPSGPTFTLAQLKHWLDREAQASAILALIAIMLAFSLKRKLLLLKTLNGVNVILLSISSVIIYMAAIKTGHSPWLTLPFMLSYVTTYKVTPAGRKIYLIKIIPSMRKVLWETAVLYRTAEGYLAYAKQSISEAFKRLAGKHIVLKDAEVGKLGEIPNDKFWSIEDAEVYEKSEGLLVLDAQLTKERVVEKEGGESIYE